jgi:hypothetical protein
LASLSGRIIADILSEFRAAVHAQGVPADPAGIVRGEERDGAGDVLRLRDLLQRLHAKPPTIDLAVGYREDNPSPVLKVFLSGVDELIAAGRRGSERN